MTEAQQTSYDRNGYVIVPQVFGPDEVSELRLHFMRLRAEGTKPGDFAGVDPASEDPLKRYPRMINMHHWDERSLHWLLDARLNSVLTDLLGRSPYAVQTMLYYKPAGARGQALHQDQFYLKVQPGTCMAAWLALDDCDEENGCMQLVPGSHQWPLLCPAAADTRESFTDVTVTLPPDVSPVPALMRAGDVLFFNGQVVHGSYPNQSQERFRRALIGHYIVGEAEKVGGYYNPVLRMDGTEATLAHSEDSTPCGVWVNRDGQREVEMTGVLAGVGRE